MKQKKIIEILVVKVENFKSKVKQRKIEQGTHGKIGHKVKMEEIGEKTLKIDDNSCTCGKSKGSVMYTITLREENNRRQQVKNNTRKST